jgi:hypothetical protein
MAKKIDSALVDEFIKETMVLEKQAIKVAALKVQLRKLDKKNMEHPLLRFEDNVSYRPDWKKIVMELTEKYMLKGPRSLFLNKTLPKRFPKTTGAKKISILSPRYEEFKESLSAMKKKLGLTKEEA